MEKFSTNQILELSFAAYRTNGGYVKQTQRFSEGQPTRYSNKELVVYSAHYYNNTHLENTIENYIPNDFVPLTVIDKDRDAKAHAEKHMRRYTMLALGNLSDFESDIFAAYSSEKVPANRIGLIAYLPEFVDRELKDREYKGRLKTEFADSAHVNLHVIEDKTVEILKMIPLREYDMYLYFGGIDKDLVSFSKKDFLEIGNKYEIRARVKNHDKERETGLPMTRLNYVKLKRLEINDC